MGTMILPDWDYPLTRRRAMTDAERWTHQHGFTAGTDFVNHRGENLARLLDAEPTATATGVVNLRWTFPDESAVELGQATWRLHIRCARNTSTGSATGVHLWQPLTTNAKDERGSSRPAGHLTCLKPAIASKMDCMEPRTRPLFP